MSRRKTEQSGYIFRRGSWWILRYRENVIEDGILVRRHMAKRIGEVQREHQRLRRPPPEIEAAAEAILNPVNAGAYSPSATQTMTEYAERRFFPDHAQLLRKSTMAGYQHRWAFVKPYCGDKRLRDFKTVDGQNLINEVARQHPEFLRSTLQHLKSLLSGFFTHAISQGILDGEVTISGTRKTVFGNPMRSVRIPRAAEGEDTHAYSFEEVQSILLHLSQPAYTIVAVAALTGLRRAEIAGLRWEDYDGQTINVARSIWEGHTDEPKTKKSKAPVPVIAQLQAKLDMYRLECGNPTTGPMFKSKAKARTPLNMNNVLNRQILPALNRCEVCRKPEGECDQKIAHKYKRDASLPEWHGWHAFRRGLATNLHALGVEDKRIQAILRHENVSMTQACYIKTVPQQSIDAMNLLNEELERRNALLCSTCAQEQPGKPN